MTHWECPCGHARSKSLNGAKPERTLVSLREPRCPFCGDTYQPDYERPPLQPAGGGAGYRSRGPLYQQAIEGYFPVTGCVPQSGDCEPPVWVTCVKPVPSTLTT
jgi:hypothetical protein